MGRTVPSKLSSMLGVMSRLTLPIVLLIFAAPFIVLLFFALPATDDFCKATLSFNCVPQPGVIRITWMYYARWSPRWVTTLLQSFIMSHVDLVASYGWLLLAVIVSNLAALWYFFRTFFSLTRSTSLLVATVFYAAYVASLPHLSEKIFWLTGATEYYLSLSTLLVLVSLLYRPRRAVWYYVAVAILSLAIPAQHEIAGTFLCGVLLAVAAVKRIKKVPALQWYLSLGMAVLSQAVVMASPGTAFRAAQENRHLWDLAHLPKWLAHSFYHGLLWLQTPSFLLAALSIVLLTQRDRQTPATSDPELRWFPLGGLCAMLFVLCENCLVETGSGSSSPERVVTWFEFVFWLLFVCVILTGVREINEAHFSMSTQASVFLLLSITLLGSSNFRAAVKDLNGPAQSWHRIGSTWLKQRGGALEFETPTQYPNMAMRSQITSDPGCWVNRCLANYLHAKSVVAKSSLEECPQ